ncbi:MAG TPA: DNA/RNA non-specific endonuclease, partial [Bacillota bacterium]|nr:DNA/RNA non-specific endonuclease [Bacillota bacterium]
IIVKAITKLISMFNPAGAIIQAVMTIYSTIQFFIERAQQIAAFVGAVFNSIAEIAGGNIGKAIAAVENALAKALPVAISFLANFIGLGGIAAKVKAIIAKIHKPIDKAIGKVVGLIADAAKKLWAKISAVANKLGGKIKEWWKNRKSFTNASGEKHTIFFQGEGSSARLMIASEVTEAIKYLQSEEVKENPENKPFLQKAGQLIAKIMAIGKKLPTNSAATPTPEQQKLAKEQQDAMEELKNTLALLQGSNKELIPFINNVDSSIKKPVEDTITNNKKEFNRVKNHKSILSKVMQLNGEVVKIYQDPFLQNHNFGKNVYNKQAFPQLNRVLSKLDKNRDDVSNSKQWLDSKVSDINAGTDSKISNKPRKAMQEQLFDTKKEGYTTQELYEGFFRALALGSVFAPKYIDTRDITNKSMVLRYSGFDGRTFTVLVGSDGLARKVKATNLNLKPKGFRADTDYDKYYVGDMGFNSSHLIGDWFGGPGQKRAYNVVTASDEFNHIEMGGVEEQIVRHFLSLKAVAMDIEVRIEWTEFISDKFLEIIVQQIASNVAGLEQYQGKTMIEIKKILRDFYSTHQKEAGLDKENLGLKRIMKVLYYVDFKIQRSPTAEVRIEPRAYETRMADIWLGLNK